MPKLSGITLECTEVIDVNMCAFPTFRVETKDPTAPRDDETPRGRKSVFLKSYMRSLPAEQLPWPFHELKILLLC
jgi:hypothetical protein